MCGSMYSYLKQSITVYLILQDKYMTINDMDPTDMIYLTGIWNLFFLVRILVS